jgi:hypothetical protein
MNRGIFCVFVCMLMIIGTIVPLSTSIFVEESSQFQINENVQYGEVAKILKNLQLNLDRVTTKHEALVLIKDTLVELHDHGLLPKGMTVRQAQRVVTRCFLLSELVQPFQTNNGNTTGNTNCLVIGITNQTFFRPFPTIYDIPIIHYLMFNTSFGVYFNFLVWFYAIRCFQPIEFGSFAYFGDRYKNVKNGNITYESIDASSGWVWTIGSNGYKKWNGTFYGGLFTKYQKSDDDNDSYAEAWNPVGIRGFVGINLFNFHSLIDGPPSFYIGFAREVNFTYSPPWT